MMADTGNLAALLGGLTLFEGVPTDALEKVAADSRVRKFRRGQIVFNAGDPGDSLVVVVSGRITVKVRSADGGELMLAIVGTGGVLGELGVIDGGPRSADAETLDDTELLFIPRQPLVDLQRDFPQVTSSMLAVVASGFRRLTDATADLVFLDLPRRVAKVLLEHPRSDAGAIDLGLSQEQLSHRVAGTRQSVNQALRGFERRGWIELAGRSVVLRDVDALARFAGDVS
jgi:CRP-like cAMP-binding protein